MTRPARGFTITELMLVLTISAILVALAIPTFQTLVLNTRRTVAVNDLLAGLLLARSEALKRGQAVGVCGIAATTSTCTGASDWSGGWLAFVDANGNGAFDSGDALLRQQRSGVRQQTVRAGGDAAANGVILLRPFNQSVISATLTVCDPRGASAARAVVVSASGRAAASETDAQGLALTCP